MGARRKIALTLRFVWESLRSAWINWKKLSKNPPSELGGIGQGWAAEPHSQGDPTTAPTTTSEYPADDVAAPAFLLIEAFDEELAAHAAQNRAAWFFATHSLSSDDEEL